jgi:hypothetical protein
MDDIKYNELCKKYKRLKISNIILIVYVLLSIIIMIYNIL